MLSITLIAATAIKNIIKDRKFGFIIFPPRKRIYPMTIFSRPQRTLTVGDDRPLPGGFAKGEGNETPEMPLTK
jgi:hypothetical protein